jgi:hypothetical protein
VTITSHMAAILDSRLAQVKQISHAGIVGVGDS